MGQLDAVAPAFAAHVGAEQRRSWTAPDEMLVLTPEGQFGARACPLAGFEEGGFRSLLVHYNESFPRATPVLSRLSPATFEAVWSELFHPGPAGYVRVFERSGTVGRSVWAVAPSTYPAEFTVADLVTGVAGLLTPSPLALLDYDAAESRVDLLLDFGAYNVRVVGTDRYDAGGVTVTVEGKDGRTYGDPLPGVKRRRREGGDTILDGVAEKLRAAPAFWSRIPRT
jgi:hypothetical protein